MIIYLEIILGIIFASIGLLVIEPVARFLGATKEMMTDCVTYGRIL